MGEYVVTRLAQTVIVMLGVSIAVFLFLHLSGDPVLLLVPPDARPEVVEATRQALGLNDPLHVQFGRFLWNVAHGDFGYSLRSNLPAMGLVQQRLPNTIQLTLVALLVSVCISIPMGVLCSTHRGQSIDHLIVSPGVV